MCKRLQFFMAAILSGFGVGQNDDLFPSNFYADTTENELFDNFSASSVTS
jgi:hypothetical protein